MAKVTVPKGKTQRRIKLRSSAERHVSPDDVAAALSASKAFFSTGHTEAPVAYLLSRQDLISRMESSGGRPKLAGTTRRPKIPVEEFDWTRLQTLAELLRQENVNVTTAQLAAALLHWALSGLGSPTTPLRLVEYFDVDVHSEKGLPPRVLQEAI